MIADGNSTAWCAGERYSKRFAFGPLISHGTNRFHGKDTKLSCFMAAMIPDVKPLRVRVDAEESVKVHIVDIQN